MKQVLCHFVKLFSPKKRKKIMASEEEAFSCTSFSHQNCCFACFFFFFFLLIHFFASFFSFFYNHLLLFLFPLVLFAKNKYISKWSNKSGKLFKFLSLFIKESFKGLDFSVYTVTHWCFTFSFFPYLTK